MILGVMIAVLPWARMAFCALGNAFFHIGGGIDSLVFAGSRFARSGIFISFGAIGVALGTLVGRDALLPAWAVSLLLTLCFAMIGRCCLQPKRNYETCFINRTAKIKLGEIAIVVCVVTVVVRAVIGTYTPVPWKNESTLLFPLPALAVFAGKFSGGLLADRFGARAVTSISLLISAPLLAFGNKLIVVCCFGLFLFNTTTAATPCVIASHLPKNPGLSFGVTTLALFLGSSLGFFWIMPEELRPILTIVLIAISAAGMYLTAQKASIVQQALLPSLDDHIQSVGRLELLIYDLGVGAYGADQEDRRSILVKAR